MAIFRLLQQSAFTPEDIGVLVSAYEDCLRHLKLADGSDPAAELVARKIIELAQKGVRDPKRLRQLALKEIGAPEAK